MKSSLYGILAVVILGTCSMFVSGSSEINVCEGVGDGVFIDDINNCSKYFACMGEVAYPAECGTDLYFSAKTQRCDVAEKTECSPKCDSTLRFYSLYKSCNAYYMCFNRVPVMQKCTDGLQYNPETNRCDYPHNVDCVTNMCTGINDPENIHFLPSHIDCGKYYICYRGEPVPQTCAKGLHFNIEKKGCDFKENVNCTIKAKSRNVLPYAKMPPTRANIPCPKQGSHFYPSPSDPAAYFFCSNGKGIVLTCSPGLVYDKIDQTCRDPKQVK